MQQVAINTVRRLRAGRQWLKRNVGTRAGILALFGGLCLGLFLRLAWTLLLLHIGTPADHSDLAAWAFATGLWLLYLGGLLVAFAVFMPHDPSIAGSAPSYRVIAWIVVVCTLFMAIAPSIGDWLLPR